MPLTCFALNVAKTHLQEGSSHAVALGSLVLTVLGAPAVIAGIVVNAAILAAVGYLILVAAPLGRLP